MQCREVVERAQESTATQTGDLEELVEGGSDGDEYELEKIARKT